MLKKRIRLFTKEYTINLKKLKKLCDELRNENFFIVKSGDCHKIFYKKVIIAHVPDEQLAEHIAKEYGGLNVRMAEQIEGLIIQIEANAKQELLNLNFGGHDEHERPSAVSAD